MIRQCLILFGCLAVGEAVVRLTGISIPGSIIGMLLLAALLQMGIIKKEWINDASGLLIANLGFFFVPAGVAIMQHFGTIRSYWLPIVVATVLSTIVVLVVTGWSHQLFKRKKDGDTE